MTRVVCNLQARGRRRKTQCLAQQVPYVSILSSCLLSWWLTRVYQATCGSNFKPFSDEAVFPGYPRDLRIVIATVEPNQYRNACAAPPIRSITARRGDELVTAQTVTGRLGCTRVKPAGIDERRETAIENWCTTCIERPCADGTMISPTCMLSQNSFCDFTASWRTMR